MPWFWDPATGEYYDPDTGRRLDAAALRDLMRKRQAEVLARIVAAVALLTAQPDERHSADFMDSLRNLLADWYTQQYLLGRGGLAQMTAADWKSITDMLAAQDDLLAGFARDIAEGKLSEAQIVARTRQYLDGSTQAFERGNARAHGVPGLPAYPKDGQTECNVGCGCGWRIEDLYDDQGDPAGWDCYWELGTTREKCPDCLVNTAVWYPLHVDMP